MGFGIKPKVILIYGLGSSRSYNSSTKNNLPRIFCDRLYIENAGRKGAEDIEVNLKWKPDEISISPSCKYDLIEHNKNLFIIKIDFIDPNKVFEIDFLYINYNTKSWKS